MIDSLLRLRHDVVVRRNNDNGNIRHLCATGTHGRKRLVSRSIQEGDMTPAFQRHVIGTDMLRDTSGFSGNHVRLAYIVEQRGLTMVDMPHDGHNRRARYQIFLIVFFLIHRFGNFRTDILRLETELFGHQINGLGIQALVDRDHDADTHTRTDNLSDRHIHHHGQFVRGNEFGKFQHLAFCCLFFELLFHGGTGILPFFLTVFGALSGFVLVRQTSQRLFYLLCYVLVRYLCLDDRLLAVLVLIMFTATLLVGPGGIIPFLPILLARYGIHIHTFLADTDAFLLAFGRILPRSALTRTVSASLAVLFFALLAFLFLRLFLRTGRLVQSRQIYMSLHLELGSSLRRMVQTEHTVRFRTDGFALLLLAYLLLAHGGLRLCLRLLLLFRSRFRYGCLRLHLSRTGGSRSLLFG